VAIGDEAPPLVELVELVNWDDLFNRTVSDDAVIDDLAFRGRWTAIASPAKAGKSTALLALAVDAARRGLTVLYLDAEMGRGDVLDRVEDWMSLKPADLVNLYYSDLPPKLDNVQGASCLWNTVEKVSPDLVIIDGLNGVVNGAENEDTTWRDMYEWAIAPMKQRGIAIVSADNAGKDRTLGPRGSSVKLDKADAVLMMERTETGIKLTATHRRTASYPAEQEYTVTDAHEGDPPMRMVRVGSGTSRPAGTKRIVAILDQLDAPVDISKRAARRLLKENGHDTPRDVDLLAMLRWRNNQFEIIGTAIETNMEPVVPGGSQKREPLEPQVDGQIEPVVPGGSQKREPPCEGGSHPLEPLSPKPQVDATFGSGTTSDKTPACGQDAPGVSLLNTPPRHHQKFTEDISNPDIRPDDDELW
jgi:hypothetical protein